MRFNRDGIFLDFLSSAVLPLQSRDRIGVLDELFILFEPALRPPPPTAPADELTAASPAVPPLKCAARYFLPPNGPSYRSPQLRPRPTTFTLSFRHSEDGVLFVGVPGSMLTALRKSTISKTMAKRLLPYARPVSPHHLPVPPA